MSQGISLWMPVAISIPHWCRTCLSRAATVPRQCGTAAPGLCSRKNSGSSMGKAAAEVYLHPRACSNFRNQEQKLEPLLPWSHDPNEPIHMNWKIELWCPGVQSKPKHILNPLQHTPSLTRECLWIALFNLTEEAAYDAGLREQLFKGIFWKESSKPGGLPELVMQRAHK